MILTVSVERLEREAVMAGGEGEQPVARHAAAREVPGELSPVLFTEDH